MFGWFWYVEKERRNIKLGGEGGSGNLEVIGKGENMIKIYYINVLITKKNSTEVFPQTPYSQVPPLNRFTAKELV